MPYEEIDSCHFPIEILGQLWCLVVSIPGPDLCPLSYFGNEHLSLLSQ